MRSLQDFKRGRIELGVNFSSAQSWLEDQWECFCQFWNWIWKDLNDNGWVPLSVCHQKCSLVWLEVRAFIIINSFYSPVNLLSKTNNIGHFYILHALLINSSLSSYKGVSYISKWRSLFSVGLIFLSEVLNSRDLDISNTCTYTFLLLNMDVSRMPFFTWILPVVPVPNLRLTGNCSSRGATPSGSSTVLAVWAWPSNLTMPLGWPNFSICNGQKKINKTVPQTCFKVFRKSLSMII